jgi:hypothetical protein
VCKKTILRYFELGISVSIVFGIYSLEYLGLTSLERNSENSFNWLLRVRKLHGIAKDLSWLTMLFSFFKY